ncbi:MAG: hypothetical protein CVT73_10010 [Alphaproteobacteria bacterium HGW-Alphaproteobacteria-12]|nr:MAG: hypothetical protein CVT73_10010 [Alphaproteobacteria bacterium HGW-Alphaproteobacteria-12]
MEHRRIRALRIMALARHAHLLGQVRSRRLPRHQRHGRVGRSVCDFLGADGGAPVRHLLVANDPRHLSLLHRQGRHCALPPRLRLRHRDRDPSLRGRSSPAPDHRLSPPLALAFTRHLSFDPRLRALVQRRGRIEFEFPRRPRHGDDDLRLVVVAGLRLAPWPHRRRSRRFLHRAAPRFGVALGDRCRYRRRLRHPAGAGSGRRNTPRMGALQTLAPHHRPHADPLGLFRRSAQPRPPRRNRSGPAGLARHVHRCGRSRARRQRRHDGAHPRHLQTRDQCGGACRPGIAEAHRAARISRHIDLLFTLPLAVGAALSLIVFSRIIPLPVMITALPEPTFGFFFGLIAASIIGLLSHVGARTIGSWAWIGLGVVLGLAAATLVPVKTPDAGWFIFLCGMVAVAAMLVPGISGSFVLLILGKYSDAIEALGRFELSFLLPLGAGALAGAIAFSRAIAWLLDRFYRRTILTVIGVLGGSLLAVWPFKDREYRMVGEKARLVAAHSYFPTHIDTLVVSGLAAMLAGIVLYRLLDRLAQHAEADEASLPPDSPQDSRQDSRQDDR